MKKPDKKVNWVEVAQWGAIALFVIVFVVLMINNGSHGHEH